MDDKSPAAASRALTTVVGAEKGEALPKTKPYQHPGTKNRF